MQTVSDSFCDKDGKEYVHQICTRGTKGMLMCCSEDTTYGIAAAIEASTWFGLHHFSIILQDLTFFYFFRSQTSGLNRDMMGNAIVACPRSLGRALLSVIFPWVRYCFYLLSWRGWGRMQIQRLPLDLLHYYSSYPIGFQFVYLETGG